ncbi:monoglyceride lipase [Trypanosoma conorhini]|uniref:Monoglyceride lipase n=1 Tax=Trypanosoma conorhini TaxID=83891 RepID=A0A3R7L5R4_9TRYP|nr:monoglyceride lipase [Trypanosoma conorhini]RNF21611.1 monoglyceride lipase [Trypanosoma conorhini]
MAAWESAATPTLVGTPSVNHAVPRRHFLRVALEEIHRCVANAFCFCRAVCVCFFLLLPCPSEPRFPPSPSFSRSADRPTKHRIMGSCCPCLRASHALEFAKPSRAPPDPELFPRYFQNKQGLWLRFAEWAPPRDVPDVRAVLFIISGVAEHTARYDAVALAFARAGYYVFCMDNQGAGGSEGKRLYVENFDDFVDDFVLFKKIVLSRYPDYATLPCCLLGHSMGGLIAAHVALRDPDAWTAVVLSGPALELDPKLTTPFMRWLVPKVSRCFPKLGVKTLDVNLISKNSQVVELAKQDPFMSSASLTARWGAEMLRAIDEFWKKVDKATFPLLIVHGGDDRLCAISGSRRFAELAPSSDKKFIAYDGLSHEVLNEVSWREVLRDVQSFVDSHCPSR